MTDELEYLANYKTNMIYIHPVEGTGTFFTLVDEQTTKRVKIVMKAFYPEKKQEITEINIFRLKYRKGNWVYEDENPKKKGIRIDTSEMLKFRQFLNIINGLDLKSLKKEKIALDQGIDQHSLEAIFQTEKGIEIVSKLVNSSDSDIARLFQLCELDRKKEQLKIFQYLLDNCPNYDEKYLTEHDLNKRGSERVIQEFFERNPWILGFGLEQVIFLDKITGNLETTTTGFEHNKYGRRIDAYMKTRGAINECVFIEFKKPSVPLLTVKEDKEHKGCWPIHQEVSQAVTQTQRTIYDCVQFNQSTIKTKKDILYNIYPKGYLIIGNANQFKSDDQKLSFELYRKQLNNFSIFTYDQLLNRAESLIDAMSYKSENFNKINKT